MAEPIDDNKIDLDVDDEADNEATDDRTLVLLPPGQEQNKVGRKQTLNPTQLTASTSRQGQDRRVQMWVGRHCSAWMSSPMRRSGRPLWISGLRSWMRRGGPVRAQESLARQLTRLFWRTHWATSSAVHCQCWPLRTLIQSKDRQPQWHVFQSAQMCYSSEIRL